MVSGCGQYSGGTAGVVRPTEPPARAMRAQVVQRNGHLSHQPPSIRPCPAKAASRHALAVIFQSVGSSGRRLDKAKRPRSGWPDKISPRLFALIGCGRIAQAVGVPKRSVRAAVGARCSDDWHGHTLPGIDYTSLIFQGTGRLVGCSSTRLCTIFHHF